MAGVLCWRVCLGGLVGVDTNALPYTTSVMSDQPGVVLRLRVLATDTTLPWPSAARSLSEVRARQTPHARVYCSSMHVPVTCTADVLQASNGQWDVVLALRVPDDTVPCLDPLPVVMGRFQTYTGADELRAHLQTALDRTDACVVEAATVLVCNGEQ